MPSFEDRLLARSRWDGDCLRWLGANNGNGYGVIKIPRGEGLFQTTVHRIAYEVWVGPIPNGYQIDHVATRGCRHRDCINPAHLEAVTRAENMRRIRRYDAELGGVFRPIPKGIISQCNRGHDYTPANTYVRPDGRYECRQCMQIRCRSFKDKRRAKAGREVTA